MSLTSAQKFLWVLAGVAALAFVWLLLWSDYRADREAYDVFLIRKDGSTEVFSSYAEG